MQEGVNAKIVGSASIRPRPTDAGGGTPNYTSLLGGMPAPLLPPAPGLKEGKSGAEQRKCEREFLTLWQTTLLHSSSSPLSSPSAFSNQGRGAEGAGEGR